MQFLVIWNIHESNVSMNGKVKCVKIQGRNGECMHMSTNMLLQ
jgi:hypothetical protein